MSNNICDIKKSFREAEYERIGEDIVYPSENVK
jgi:hypothetical protein